MSKSSTSEAVESNIVMPPMKQNCEEIEQTSQQQSFSVPDNEESYDALEPIQSQYTSQVNIIRTEEQESSSDGKSPEICIVVRSVDNENPTKDVLNDIQIVSETGEILSNTEWHQIILPAPLVSHEGIMRSEAGSVDAVHSTVQILTDINDELINIADPLNTSGTLEEFFVIHPDGVETDLQQMSTEFDQPHNRIDVFQNSKTATFAKDKSDSSSPTGRAGKKRRKQLKTVYTCNINGCKQTFSDTLSFRNHHLVHSADRPYKCTYNFCHWTFKSRYHLKRHMEGHTGRKNYQCLAPNCGRRFSTIYNLKTHKEQLHTFPLPQVCPKATCLKRFSSKRALSFHLKSHPELGKSHKCQFEGCTRAFVSQLGLDTHVRSHSRATNLTCNFCSKKFAKSVSLKVHERSHTGEKPYPCLVQGCNWYFTTSSKLHRHMQTHTTERKYTCTVPECGKSYKRKEHLRMHEEIHKNTFRCTYSGCSATFTGQASLRRHLQRHTFPEIYHCPLDNCNKFFNSKSAVRQHLAKHHQNDKVLEHIASQIVSTKPDTPQMPSITFISGERLISPLVCNKNQLLASHYEVPLLKQDSTTVKSSDSQGCEISSDTDAALPLDNNYIDILPSCPINQPDARLMYLPSQLLQDDHPTGELFPPSPEAQIPSTTINLHDLQ